MSPKYFVVFDDDGFVSAIYDRPVDGGVEVVREVVDVIHASGDFGLWCLKNGQVAPSPRQLRNDAKTARSAAVAAIRVTTAAGNTFDGDEISQGRMARAIIALQATGTTTVPWVLADNSAIQATAAELTEALALAGAAQAAVWVIE